MATATGLFYLRPSPRTSEAVASSSSLDGISQCGLLLSAPPSRFSRRKGGVYCQVPGSVGEDSVKSDGRGAGRVLRRQVEDYNSVMRRLMRNPYEYHHDLGMNYTYLTDTLIVGSQPQRPEDIDHLKDEENVAYILCVQQDKDIQYWGIDFELILKRCKELGIHHFRKPAQDFDPDSLRTGLPSAVSLLDWAISQGNGRVYVHCTAGLGRAPAVAIAYLFWFCQMDLKMAYEMLTSKRPCGPNKQAIRGATYDLIRNGTWKEPFESLPENAFADISPGERNLIQEQVRGICYN